jgi:DNA-binding IclR family transcriptional regulator
MVLSSLDRITGSTVHMPNYKGLTAAETDLEQDDDKSSGSDIQAVSRAAQILGLFSPALPKLTSADVARLLRLNRTTAYRYCVSMAAAQLLQRQDDGKFAPGAIIAQLAPFVMSSHEIITRAQPHLQRLSASTGMTAVLSLWGATGPVISAVAESHSADALVTIRVGTHLGIDAAQARVFYAYHADQLYITRLLANLPQSQRDSLMADVDLVRQRGYATNTNSRGISIHAAPIFAQDGLCASMAIMSTRDMLADNAGSKELHALVHEAGAMTQEMGGVFPGERTR